MYFVLCEKLKKINLKVQIPLQKYEKNAEIREWEQSNVGIKNGFIFQFFAVKNFFFFFVDIFEKLNIITIEQTFN